MADRIWRIKACLNGQRGQAEHPAVPVTPAQLAGAAAGAVAAGAEAVHLHPRGRDGSESLRAADVGAAVAAVRTACPATPVGVTTALWVTGSSLTRRDDLMAWDELDPEQRPDFASVNVGEDGWQELTAILADAGIGAEAGISSVAEVAAVASFMPPAPWVRILVEVVDATSADATMLADEILDALNAARATAKHLDLTVRVRAGEMLLAAVTPAAVLAMLPCTLFLASAIQFSLFQLLLAVVALATQSVAATISIRRALRRGRRLRARAAGAR